ATFGVEARGDGDRLQQRALPASVLANQKRQPRIELQLVELGDRGDVERILAEVGDLVPLEADRTNEALCRPEANVARHRASVTDGSANGPGDLDSNRSAHADATARSG